MEDMFVSFTNAALFRGVNYRQPTAGRAFLPLPWGFPRSATPTSGRFTIQTSNP